MGSGLGRRGRGCRSACFGQPVPLDDDALAPCQVGAEGIAFASPATIWVILASMDRAIASAAPAKVRSEPGTAKVCMFVPDGDHGCGG